MTAFCRYLALIAALFVIVMPISALADDPADMAEASLPADVLAQVHAPLKLVGEGNYRKFGFKIYHASLWAPEGEWNPHKPFVLKMRYARDLSKDTLIDALIDDIHDENVADSATLDRWRNQLQTSMPAVQDGDTIIGVSIPGHEAVLYHNGEKLSKIDDAGFSKAFFDIWLGPTADESLHKKLLGQADE